MRRLVRPVVLLLLSTVVVGLIGVAIVAMPASRAAAAAADRAPAVHVFSAPTAVPGTDGRRHLVYEVVLENGPRGSVRLDRLDVRDPDRGRLLATYRGRSLADLVVRLDGRMRTRTIPEEHDRPDPARCLRRAGPPRPDPSRHPPLDRPRLGGARSARRLTTAVATRVRRRESVHVAPPLHGGSLGVLGCCRRPFAHRLAVTTRNSPLVPRPVFAAAIRHRLRAAR